MLENRRFTLCLRVGVVLRLNHTELVRLSLLTFQPRLRLAIRADSRLYVTDLKRVFLKDEFADEILDVLLRLESDRFGKRFGKLFFIEPQVMWRRHLGKVILLAGKQAFPAGRAFVFAPDVRLEFLLGHQFAGRGDFSPIKPGGDAKVSLLRARGRAGVWDADAPRLAARRLVALGRPGEFQCDEGNAVAADVVRLVIACVVGVAKTIADQGATAGRPGGRAVRSPVLTEQDVLDQIEQRRLAAAESARDERVIRDVEDLPESIPVHSNDPREGNALCAHGWFPSSLVAISVLPFEPEGGC